MLFRSKIATDALTGALFYAVTSSSYSKITVSGTTISAVYSIAASPIAIGSDTLTDRAVNYSGTYYTWNLPQMVVAITPNKWLSGTSTFLLYGPIS